MTQSKTSVPSTSQEPKYSWDYDIPQTPFWADLPFTTGRNFLQCYTSDEIAQMDPEFFHLTTLTISEKHQLLVRHSHVALAAREAGVAPASLKDADNRAWHRYMLAIYTSQNELKLPEARDTLQLMLDNSSGDDRVPWLNMMAAYTIDQGDYVQGEKMEREVLPWMQNHPRLGVDSPQALGTMRRITVAVWKQGREVEARGLVTEMEALVEGLSVGPSKFVKYQEDERQELGKVVDELEKWTQARAGGE
ncbi:hypothetical protein B0T25DRAFT_626938 [Lasiosphaeria hispida]|uniref:Uncharacterized protein n=1 Tax=Lasiosphaeria hispida TaxID=260671 RepID=A0AAJ0HTR4_9PEZI|nr:hypothetical protein B0T25DRAFT_626938 [Lasiosphaeria hispida]